jgi:hypothetical protein
VANTFAPIASIVAPVTAREQCVARSVHQESRSQNRTNFLGHKFTAVLAVPDIALTQRLLLFVKILVAADLIIIEM